MSADLGPDPVRGPMHRDMGDYRAVLRRAMEIPGLSMAVMYSGPLGLAVSWLLLRAYRRAVLRSMAAAATPASATWQPSPVELIRPPTPMRGEGAAPPTFDAIRRRWRRTTLSYGFGGMVFMAVEYAAALPSADLLYSSPYDALMTKDTVGGWVDVQKVGDRNCDHLAYRRARAGQLLDFGRRGHARQTAPKRTGVVVVLEA